MNNKTELLKEKVSNIGAQTITFCKSLKQDSISKPLISQIIRSSTSIGANYFEAINGSSRKDFANKIFICKKETQETQHWLKMLNVYFPERKNEINLLLSETQELVKIFQKTIITIKLNNEKFNEN